MTDNTSQERQAILAAIERVLAGTTRYAEPGALTQTRLLKRRSSIEAVSSTSTLIYVTCLKLARQRSPRSA